MAHTGTSAPIAPCFAAARIDAHHDALVARIADILRTADLAVELGMATLAADCLAELAPLQARVDAIRACWVKR